MAFPPFPNPNTFAAEQDLIIARIRLLYNTLVDDFSLPPQLRGNEMMLDCGKHLFYAERTWAMAHTQFRAAAPVPVNGELFDLHLNDLHQVRELVGRIRDECWLLEESVRMAQEAGESVSGQLLGGDGRALNDWGVVYDVGEDYEGVSGGEGEGRGGGGEEGNGFGGLYGILVMAGLACGLALIALLPAARG